MGKHDINAFLGVGTSFVGRLTFDGVVRIDGEFEGEIVSSGTLVVGSQARVAGRIAVGRLVCDGFVAAEVAASASVAVHARGRVVGSVCTPSLVVDEGGRLDGLVSMGGDVVLADPPALAAGTSPETSQKPDRKA